MSMQDPLADMLTRIRNAQMAEKAVCEHAFFQAEGLPSPKSSRTKVTSRIFRLSA